MSSCQETQLDTGRTLDPGSIKLQQSDLPDFERQWLNGGPARHETLDTIGVARGLIVHLYYANSTVPSWGRVGVRQTNPSKVKSALPIPRLIPPLGNGTPRFGKEGASYPHSLKRLDGRWVDRKILLGRSLIGRTR